MRNKFFFYSVIIFFIINSCECKRIRRTNVIPEITNIVVLLDLSDRILKPGQIQRDKDIIVKIYNKFIDIQRSKLFFNSRDKFKVVIANQVDQFPNNQIFEIEDSLIIDVEKTAITAKKNIKSSLPGFKSKIESLYNLAKFSPNPNDYKGANILKYLQNNLVNDLPQKADSDNFLFILTDGYQYVEGKNYKPIDAWPNVCDMSNISVSVLEVDPAEGSGDNEFLKINNAWELWLNNMKAQPIKIFQKTAISNVFSSIDKILTKSSSISSPTPPFKSSSTDTLSTKQNSDDWIGNILEDLNNKIMKTTITCEQTEYINLKNQIIAHMGQVISQSKITSFEQQIQNVPNLCPQD